MANVELFPGTKTVPEIWNVPCQELISRENLCDPAQRTEFPQLFFDLCPNQTIEGGFRIGVVEGTDLDNNTLAVKILFHPKINDQVLTFYWENETRKIALREKEPKIYVIPNGEGPSYAEPLTEKDFRNYLQKAMDVYYSTLSLQQS